MVTETAFKNYLSDHPGTVTLPEEFNSAVIGVTSGGRIAYDYMSLVKVLMETLSLDYKGAYDYICFNISDSRDIVIVEEL